MRDLAFAWKAAKHIKSNAIVFAKDRTLTGMGAGQPNRVTSVHLALRAAGEALADTDLSRCTLYTTFEPCPMCAGASVNSKLDQIVFGARDKDVGACGTVHDIAGDKNSIHKISVLPGILEHDSKLLLTKFFKSVRKESKPKSE